MLMRPSVALCLSSVMFKGVNLNVTNYRFPVSGSKLVTGDRELNFCVRMEGLDHPRLSAPDPKSGTATNYATCAKLYFSFFFVLCQPGRQKKPFSSKGSANLGNIWNQYSVNENSQFEGQKAEMRSSQMR